MADKTSHILRIALIAAVALIAYSNSFHSEFHFDDYSSIITSPHIRSLSNIPHFFYYGDPMRIGRPATMATFAVNYAIGGLNPFSYHVANFIIHLLNAILVYILLLFTLKGRVSSRMDVSCLAALIFAVHPLQTQAVTYIAQRGEILSALFYLLSLTLFAKARIDQRTEVKAEFKVFSASTLTLYSLSFFSAVLAMGSKETAVTLPITILLYDFFFISNGNVKAISKKSPVHLMFFLTLIPFMYFMGIPQIMSFISGDAVQSPPTSGMYAVTPSISRYEYFLTQFRVIWTYIILLILPINQNVDYDYPLSESLFNPVSTLFGVIGIIAVFVFAVFLFKRHRIVSFFIIWFFLVLAPTSSLAVLPDVIFEHRLYLPSLGFFVIFAMGIFRSLDVILNRVRTR